MEFRAIEVTRLRRGDVVRPGVKPQVVEYVRIRKDGMVRLRLSGEATGTVDPGFVYQLIRKAGEST